MIASYFLFFFAGLGAFNGFALALYLLWLKPATSARRWLAVLVLMVSIRTGKSVLFFFWPEISKLVLQIGLTACFLIGPSLIGFVRAWANSDQRKTRSDPLYGVCLLALAIGFGVLFPYADHVNLWSMPVWRAITYSWLACLLLALSEYFRASKQKGKEIAPDGLTQGHVAAVIAGVAVIWLAYFTAGITSYIVGALSFSLVLYLSGIVVIAQHKLRPLTAPYHDRKIAPTEAEAALKGLHTLMVDEGLYKDPALTLVKVARRLNVPPARLSQLLNDNKKTAFKPYLAQLRINAAKELLRSSTSLSMEQVAEACGFLAVSTFYSSFKKLEGMTPAGWRQAQQHLDIDSQNRFQESGNARQSTSRQ